MTMLYTSSRHAMFPISYQDATQDYVAERDTRNMEENMTCGDDKRHIFLVGPQGIR